MSRQTSSQSVTPAIVENMGNQIDRPMVLAVLMLDPHPLNPRLMPRTDIIEAIAAAIKANNFDPAHAIIVRPLDGGRYQIVSGHNRVAAATQAGLASLPAWVREMDDATAYMELVRSNMQGELSALERGMHALHSGMDVKAYAESVGRKQQSVSNEVLAARVAESVPHMGYDLSDYFRHLTEIHAAPSWLWPALVKKLVDKKLTVEKTHAEVAQVKSVPKLELWMNEGPIANEIVLGFMPINEIQEMVNEVKSTIRILEINRLEADNFKTNLYERLSHFRPTRLSEVLTHCDHVRGEQEAMIAEQRREQMEKQRQREERQAAIARMRINVSLDEWTTLDAETRAELFSQQQATTTFNKQDSDAIEWAQFSWNPVTGCLHDCPYCYARDIAQSGKMVEIYPYQFTPAFRPSSLLAPSNTKVPDNAANDTRFRNVFTCSMADLFGRWVPTEWITAVLDTVRANPQWNFLFLTKFPKRMAEFDIPDNAWMGTTVDLQARVKNAEAAFSKVSAGIRWLSVEPMIEPLKFTRLDLFQWIVIGGASRSEMTPEWRPPFEWINDLYNQARKAGLSIYQKTNLGVVNRTVELPFGAPIRSDKMEAPTVFHYLGTKPERKTE